MERGPKPRGTEQRGVWEGLRRWRWLPLAWRLQRAWRCPRPFMSSRLSSEQLPKCSSSFSPGEEIVLQFPSLTDYIRTTMCAASGSGRRLGLAGLLHSAVASAGGLGGRDWSSEGSSVHGPGARRDGLVIPSGTSVTGLGCHGCGKPPSSH